MLKEKIRLEAKDENEALNKAYNSFQQEFDEDFTKDNISLDIIEEKRKLFGLIKDSNVYEAVLEVNNEPSIDGNFKVKVRDEGIFLEVKQPLGNGRDVQLNEVEEVLADKEIVDVDYAAISEALSLDHEEIKIAERKPDLDRDAELEVNISSDELEAYLNYIPPLGGQKLTFNQVYAQLKEEGLINIKKEKLDNEFDPSKKLDSLLIAEGEEPSPGKDAQINLEFNPSRRDKKVTILEDGNADFYNLNRVVNVEPDDLLVTKEPAVEGTPGKSVLGEEIPPEPVEDKKLPVGKNVKVDDDKLTIKAEIEGQVVYNGKTVSVLDVHTVEGDVDLSTGNINFTKGSVIVKGDVKEGMKVKAKGNVKVTGSVYGGIVEAGGEIIIQNGFVGVTNGQLTAEGDIQVSFIENGVVNTDKSLFVKDAIMHSQVDAVESIILEQGKGLIVGGEIRAGKEINAITIGSNLGTTTNVSVGVTPDLRDEFREIDSKLKDTQEKLETTIKNINLLKKKKRQIGELSDKRQDLLNQLTRQRFKLASELNKLKEKNDKFTKRFEAGKEGTIKVKNTIYPGVIISIGLCMEQLDKSKSHVKYYIEDSEIKSGSYS